MRARKRQQSGTGSEFIYKYWYEKKAFGDRKLASFRTRIFRWIHNRSRHNLHEVGDRYEGFTHMWWMASSMLAKREGRARKKVCAAREARGADGGGGGVSLSCCTMCDADIVRTGGSRTPMCGTAARPAASTMSTMTSPGTPRRDR